MITIRINGNPIKPGTVISDDIETVSIDYPNGFPIHVPQGQGKQFIQWLYALTQRATSHIIVNNVIMSKEQVNKIF